MIKFWRLDHHFDDDFMIFICFHLIFISFSGSKKVILDDFGRIHFHRNLVYQNYKSCDFLEITYMIISIFILIRFIHFWTILFIFIVVKANFTLNHMHFCMQLCQLRTSVGWALYELNIIFIFHTKLMVHWTSNLVQISAWKKLPGWFLSTRMIFKWIHVKWLSFEQI